MNFINYSDEDKIRKKIPLEIQLKYNTVIIDHDEIYYNASQLCSLVYKDVEEWIDLDSTYNTIKYIEKIFRNDNRKSEKLYYYKSNDLWIHYIILKHLSSWLDDDAIVSGIGKHLLQIKYLKNKNNHIKWVKQNTCSNTHDLTKIKDTHDIVKIKDTHDIVKIKDTHDLTKIKDNKIHVGKNICKSICVML